MKRPFGNWTNSIRTSLVMTLLEAGERGGLSQKPKIIGEIDSEGLPANMEAPPSVPSTR